MTSNVVAVTSRDPSHVLVPSSQRQEYSSEPPSKRRRTGHYAFDSDDLSGSQASVASLELPSSAQEYMEIDDDILQNYRSKYEDRMHEPAYVETQSNEFVTQIEQPWSSPTRIRGPRWRKKTPTPSVSPERGPPTSRPAIVTLNTVEPAVLLDEFDDDGFDELMNCRSFREMSPSNARSLDVGPGSRPNNRNMRQTTLFGLHATQQNSLSSHASQRAHNWPLAQRNEAPTHHKINEAAMEKWIFPLNVGSVRDYQYNIVHKALFNNILVALPTGLGKTFIAAAVMMNWYNWTKDAQIVFMAPTKPLVAQQIEACFHIAGIPRSQTTLMTGEIPGVVRAEEWQTKRVFFMTPQTLRNDLTSGIADPKRLVLLVVDEAHKATGNYAYTEVVRFMRRFNNSFRILALTATPGATVEAVQKVIDGLDIARVEIRTEDSLDIRGFVHQRNTELQVFDYSDEIEMCMDLFSKAVKPVLDKLCSQNASWVRDPVKMTLFGLQQSRKQWFASEAGRRANKGVQGMIHACFTPLMSLAHNLELLKFHGIGPFYHKMKAFQDDDSGGKWVKVIKESESFTTLMSRMRAWINSDDFVGHPKLEYLKGVVLNHFMDAGEGRGRAGGRPPSDTRIMIFAHYRDSAEEICRVLRKHEPMLRPHVFVGQSSTKNSEGMDQKMQTEIIKKFKAGTYNTLVATSIGEEGLDIGEVDLIVCYDCSKSPIRMLQRMGRTGRKRAGNIVMLLMRDKEERDYYQARDNYSKIQEIIESGREFNFHDDCSPRIVPKTIVPVVSKEHIDIPIENTQSGSVEPSKRKAKNKMKKQPKKFHMPDGVETGFTFLGQKKSNEPQTERRKKRKRAGQLDVVEAPLPPDSEVQLSCKQEDDLNEKYAWVPGEEPQQIEQIDFGKHPEKLREEDKTFDAAHSKTTTRMLKAFRIGIRCELYKTMPPKQWEDMQHFASDEPEHGDWEQGGGAEHSRQESATANGSQDEALPDLDMLFGRAPTLPTDSESHKARRSKRVLSDDDD